MISCCPAAVLSGFSRSRSWSMVHSIRVRPSALARGNSSRHSFHGNAWILPSTMADSRPCMKPMRSKCRHGLLPSLIARPLVVQPPSTNSSWPVTSDGKIQAFPWNEWREEFSRASALGLTRIELTIDRIAYAKTR